MDRLAPIIPHDMGAVGFGWLELCDAEAGLLLRPRHRTIVSRLFRLALRFVSTLLILFKIWMAGALGFEPRNVGTKNRCLTTWRRPNGPCSYKVWGEHATNRQATILA